MPPAWHSESSSLASPKLHELDVLRGACALTLVLYHADFAFPGRELSLIRNGGLFVDFFFVLSGFIIFYNYPRLPHAARSRGSRRCGSFASTRSTS